MRSAVDHDKADAFRAQQPGQRAVAPGDVYDQTAAVIGEALRNLGMDVLPSQEPAGCQLVSRVATRIIVVVAGQHSPARC